VLAAGDRESPEATQALETLCRTYWYPVYAYVRRKGYDEHHSSDLTQEFFCRMLERSYLRTADRRRGRFRAFMLACLERFLAKEWTRARRRKRGGGLTILSLDDGSCEARYLAEADSGLDPARVFQRRWARAVIDAGLEQLESEYAAAGKAGLYAALRPFLSGQAEAYAELASRLHLSDGALRVAVHRLRRRYGECLREIIARTVSRAEDVDEEVGELLAALE
jgi:RNA polymerase sigma-70 factor (ECF subfamily)